MSKKNAPLDDLLIFHQVACSLTSTLNLNTILRTIIAHMERFVEADLWTLLILDEARQDLYYAVAVGKEKDSLQNLRIKVGEGIAGWVVQHGETMLVPEAQNDPRINTAQDIYPKFMHSVIALPLRGRRGTHGVIEIFNPSSAQLSDYTVAFLHILADYAAIAIENAHDVAHIQKLTITDDTTGLYNVRHLYKVLGEELERSLQSRRPLSLVFLDLDRFKRVNDLHGHLVGSELLVRTGRRLRELCPQQNLCFRYGGDEFVILMPDTGARAALEDTQALNQALKETIFTMKNGLELQVSASMGVATAPDDGASVHTIIGAADTRMYEVKTSGRGAVRGA